MTLEVKEKGRECVTKVVSPKKNKKREVFVSSICFHEREDADEVKEEEKEGCWQQLVFYSNILSVFMLTDIL